MGVTLVAPALIYIRWDCRRCGHQGGMARTTIPFDLAESEAMTVIMDQQLRRKLVRTHQNRQGCIALPEDFVVTRVNPYGDRTV